MYFWLYLCDLTKKPSLEIWQIPPETPFLFTKYYGNYVAPSCAVRFLHSSHPNIIPNALLTSRSQWPRGLRRRSSAAHPLRLWVRIPPWVWMFVCCEFCVLSGRGLCDGLITRPEESYRLWRVFVCDQETSRMRRLKPATGAVEDTTTMGCNVKKTNKTSTPYKNNSFRGLIAAYV